MSNLHPPRELPVIPSAAPTFEALLSNIQTLRDQYKRSQLLYNMSVFREEYLQINPPTHINYSLALYREVLDLRVPLLKAIRLIEDQTGSFQVQHGISLRKMHTDMLMLLRQVVVQSEKVGRGIGCLESAAEEELRMASAADLVDIISSSLTDETLNSPLFAVGPEGEPLTIHEAEL